jgi:hypothetical protein
MFLSEQSLDLNYDIFNLFTTLKLTRMYIFNYERRPDIIRK